MSSTGFWWFGFGFLVAASMIQASVLDWIKIGSAKPDLLLIALVWFSLDLRLASSLALGLAAAILRLVTTAEPSVYVLLSFLSVSCFLVWAAKRLVKEELWVQLGLLGISSLAVDTLGLVWFYPMGSFGLAFFTRFFLNHVMLPTFYTLILAPFCWRWINQFLIRCGWESFTELTS